jgi:hypothetical protein
MRWDKPQDRHVITAHGIDNYPAVFRYHPFTGSNDRSLSPTVGILPKAPNRTIQRFGKARRCDVTRLGIRGNGMIGLVPCRG